jgi:hypothetical protein
VSAPTSPAAGSTPWGARIPASCPWKTTKNSSECHSAIFRPVRYDARSVTAIRCRYKRKRRGLSAKPVAYMVPAR